MYLLKYDSNYGPLHGFELSIEPNTETTKPDLLGQLVISGKRFRCFSKRSSLLPWAEFGVDVVVDCTGNY